MPASFDEPPIPPLPSQCYRCPTNICRHNLCQICTDFYNHTQSATGIDVIWLISQFLDNPITLRKKPYSCDEYIALCLLLLKKNEPYIFVPIYQQGCLHDDLRTEEELKALMELKSHRIFSLKPGEMRELKTQYEKEKWIKQKLNQKKRIQVLEDILLFIEHYKKYNSFKTGTGVIRRVKEDIKYYLEKKASQWGLDLSDHQLTNDYVFWIQHFYKFYRKSCD